jgi:transcriptional regulator with XRE-family HTH domain
MQFTDCYEVFGRAIALRRKGQGMSQDDLAKAVGLSRASIANIETGRQKVLLHHVYMIAAALNCKSILELIPSSISPPHGASPTIVGETQLTPQQRAMVLNLFQSAVPSSKGR